MPGASLGLTSDLLDLSSDAINTSAALSALGSAPHSFAHHVQQYRGEIWGLKTILSGRTVMNMFETKFLINFLFEIQHTQVIFSQVQIKLVDSL